MDLGADIVMYSLTKYMNGHSDVIMGAAITRREDLEQRLRFIQNGEIYFYFLKMKKMMSFQKYIFLVNSLIEIMASK